MNNRENAGSACPSIVTLVVQHSGLAFVCLSQVGILSKWMNVSSWFVVQKLSRQARSHAATRLAIRGSHVRHIPATEAVTGIRCLLSSCDPEAKEEEGARRDTDGLV